METGQLVAFGDRPQDLLLDGAMASAAVPPYFPPWEVDQRHYLDGGVYAKLPLRVALDRGATQILALDVSHAMGSRETAQGVLGISGYALSLMVEAQAAQEIAMTHARGVALRVLRLRAPQDVTFWDYTQADRLIRAGREIARKMLDQEPVPLRPPWWLNLRRRLASTFASRRLGWSLALEEEFKEGGEADRARRGEEGE
jgi:NTE family protein